MHNRRTFIKTLSAATVAGIAIPNHLLAMKKHKTIGIQLYTIRDLVKQDFEGTLSLLYDIGYSTVEAAGYQDRKFYGYFPKEYKKIVEDHGLQPISSHSKTNLADAQKTIDDTLEAGMSYLVIPWIPPEVRETTDDYRKLADEFNVLGEMCNKSGLTFGYHNHEFEFEEIDGVVPYNILLENTDPEYVTFQMDLYWTVYGRYNPTEYFQQFPGRFKLWHVKDMDDTPEMESTEVGKGVINFQQIFKQQKKAGLEYIFVEQESFKMEPEESIAISYHYLKNLTAF